MRCSIARRSGDRARVLSAPSSVIGGFRSLSYASYSFRVSNGYASNDQAECNAALSQPTERVLAVASKAAGGCLKFSSVALKYAQYPKSLGARFRYLMPWRCRIGCKRDICPVIASRVPPATGKSSATPSITRLRTATGHRIAETRFPGCRPGRRWGRAPTPLSRPASERRLLQ